MPPHESTGDLLHVLAPGNDRHRDLMLLREVARVNPDLDVLVMSRRRRARQPVSSDVPNYRVTAPSGTKDLIDGYAWADVVAVPLKKNLHGSGVTFALESSYSRRPVAITDVGGIADYFDDRVTYARPGVAASLADAIREAGRHAADAGWLERIRSEAEKRGLTARDYGLRHAALSWAALAAPGPQRDPYLNVSSDFATVRLPDVT